MNDTDITTDRRLLAATFANPADAGRCVRHLLEAGFPEAAVGIVMADSAEARQLLETGPAKPAETAAIGSAVGATLFGLAAVALAGPIGVIAVGPLVAGLGGAAVGAGAGGIAGALVGLGIPEHEAALRAERVQRGGALVTCAAGSDAMRARAILERHGAEDTFEV